MAFSQLAVPTMDQLDLVCMVLDGDGLIRWENANGHGLGTAAPESARFLADLVHPDDQGTAADLLDETVGRGRAQRIVRLLDGDRGPIYLQLKAARTAPGQDASDELVVQGWDVTDLIQRQHELERYAFRDPLTGVPNRLAFMARLDQELSMSRLPRHQVAVLFADIDDFTAVNDLHGHDMGDRVLTELASRLAESIRPNDLLGRIGGDEFAIICPDLIGWPAAGALIDRLRSVAAQSISTASGPITVTVSVGAAFAEKAGARASAAADLMARADQRMFESKPGGPPEAARRAEA